MSDTESTNKAITEPTANHARRRENPLKRLYNWVLLQADHPAAPTVLFWIAFAEATFFPIPPDVLLLAMAVAAPTKALRFAVICTAGSVLGGVVGYLMGWGLWSQIDTLFYQYIPGFTEAKFDSMATTFANNTFATIFAAGFTPIPFKVFTIAAGAAVVPFFIFLLGALLSRGLRFGLLALLIYWFGESVKTWIDRYFNLLSIIGTVVIIALFYWIKSH